ncbi:hypothetical protein P3S67_000878 [Capsicum chacoense]
MQLYPKLEEFQSIENGGGGWQGQGCLGNGKWTVSRAIVGSNGCCKCCAKKLVTIDLDPKETENIAKSVASQAVWRERNSIFQKFQIERMDAIIEAVLVQNCVGFSVGHKVVTFLRNYLLRQDGTVTSFVRALKVYGTSPTAIEPLSFVLKILVDEGDNKCLHEAGRYHKVALLDLYLEALDPELYNSRLSNHDCDNAKDKSLLSDNDKLFKLQKAKVTNQVICKIRDLPAAKLSQLLKSWERLTRGIGEVSSKVGCLIVLDRDIKFLDLGEVVGTKSGGLDYIFAL